MRERRLFRAGWLVAVVDFGFRFIDPTGRVYQLLESRLAEAEADSLRELIAAGAASFDLSRTDASFGVVAACTLPQDVGVGMSRAAQAQQSGYVYWLGASTPASLAWRSEVSLMRTPNDLAAAPDGEAVLIARRDQLADPE